MELQELLQLVTEVQGARSWDVAALIRVGGVVAAKVNGLQNLSGQEKKTLVCQVLAKALDVTEQKECKAQGVSTEDAAKIQARYAELKVALQTVVPAALDLAVSAARGKLDLKKVSPSVWAQAFSCCVSSAVSVLASQKLISEAQAQQAVALEKRATEVALAAAEAKAASAEATRPSEATKDPVVA